MSLALSEMQEHAALLPLEHLANVCHTFWAKLDRPRNGRRIHGTSEAAGTETVH
jgi:hypothetical protein